jgi:hypothetical protein
MAPGTPPPPTPVEAPAIGSPVILIAKPVNGHTVEAVPCTVADDASNYVKAYYQGRWLVVERDPATDLVRESTGTYADERAAYYAYWYASADEPLDFEAWISPLFATSIEEAA